VTVVESDVDDEPAPRRRGPVMVAIAALLVLALALGGIIVAVDRGRDPGAPTTEDAGDLGPPAEVDVGPPPTQTELDALVAELSAFVADARGLEFREPVHATLLDDEAFAARVREDAVDDLAELEETKRVLAALGLVDPDVDLAAVLSNFLGQGVVGQYDPDSGELLVRGAALSPYVRITLVHELTHALDDQHFELDRPVLDDADDETGLAFGALVEGNAVRIEDVYRDSLSEDERAAADAEEMELGAGLDLSGVPRVVPELIAFPYVFGPAMVGALDESGGEARVDEAYVEPPVTSEQVLDPAGWLAGDAEPVVVPPPEADGEVFDQGVLGLWGIVLLLEEELGQRDAFDAAQGWGGDWYVAWRDGDETCVRATFVMDTADDLRELASGLDDWAAAQDDAVVDRTDDAVTLTSCA
jgi:hypothetical protein